MAATQTLKMVFLNQAGSRTTISVDNPRDDVTEAEIRAAMDMVISKNIFTTSGGDLAAIHSATIVDTTTTEIIAGA
ncbi:DUF2922 domain-containing protein [Desulfolucanica intricata]|uniref:DUF2922 domain-containing protein n=1 Tax=Desulfolucanica intricata TaxID=1285191 RepID=UPI00082A105E|nr:DUF2922 domain-containing protein [Desulfolucanica intricata]